MNISRRKLLFCAPAVILTPKLLMPVKPIIATITYRVVWKDEINDPFIYKVPNSEYHQIWNYANAACQKLLGVPLPEVGDTIVIERATA